jgi:hypothetical protein
MARYYHEYTNGTGFKMTEWLEEITIHLPKKIVYLILKNHYLCKRNKLKTIKQYEIH